MTAPGDATPNPPAPRRTRRRRAPRCAACGYSLATLYENSLCPECGAPAWHSAYGSLLTMRWPPLIRRMRRGASLVVWGLAALLVVSLVQFAIYRALQPRGAPVRVIAMAMPGPAHRTSLRWPDGRTLQITESANGESEILRLWEEASPRRALVRHDDVIEYDPAPPPIRPRRPTRVQRFLVWLGDAAGLGQRVFATDMDGWSWHVAVLRDGSIGWRRFDDATGRWREIRIDTAGAVQVVTFSYPPRLTGLMGWRAGGGAIVLTGAGPIVWIIQIVRVIATTCLFAGVWLLTTSDGRRENTPRRALAWLVRIVALLGACALICRAVAYDVPLLWASSWWGTMHWISRIAEWAFPLGAVVLLLYLRAVLRTLGRPHLGIAVLALAAAQFGLFLRKPLAMVLVDHYSRAVHLLEFQLGTLLSGSLALLTVSAIILLALLRKALVAPAETALARITSSAAPQSPA